MQERAPLIDQQTWEVLSEVYRIISEADAAQTAIHPRDISYMNGLMHSTLKLNSLPANGVVDRPGIMEKLHAAAEKFKP